MIVATLALIGVFVSTYLTLYKLGYIGTLQCAVGSCETVNTSQWATFLGLPVAAWGLGFYVVALALALLGVQERSRIRARCRWRSSALTGWGVAVLGLADVSRAVRDPRDLHVVCDERVHRGVMFLVSLADLRVRTA